MEQNKREIKFRAWDKENKKMLYEIPLATVNFYSSLEEFFKHTELMQYIGLKDKNGKEIYEGDVLLGRFILDEVEDHIFLSLTEDEKRTQSKIFVVDDMFYPYTNQIPEDLEVIGNIYENPNLLSEK